MMMSESVVERDYIKDFLLGGRCECIIENTQAGSSFLYKIKSNKNGLYFVYSHTGIGDIYGGFLKLNEDGSVTYATGTKGQIPITDIRIQVLLFVLNHPNNLPSFILVGHLGKCSRCGRKLTDPDSIRRGLGPECAKKSL